VKCKIFYGIPITVEAQFNEWAKGKALTRDIIIHTIPFPVEHGGLRDFIAIIIYYPEGSIWDVGVQE